ncbi:hypothetical protein B0T17DRAFT_507509 [Bombardia bombarda]|uniref:Uncharacterized protein n=1 Tax=Bombardia bombarda TaxID=252184 RepID=A0AA39XCB0_9PEZI|nr:hypothetical protein B0T17DRAFT_507509 [Bombardia bombarda]
MSISHLSSAISPRSWSKGSSPSMSTTCLSANSAIQPTGSASSVSSAVTGSPKVNITLYFNDGGVDFIYDDSPQLGDNDDDTKAYFATPANPPPPCTFATAWSSFVDSPIYKRNAFTRLGEGFLNGGYKGDTSWKKMMDELLREEMFMRNVGSDLFTSRWKAWLLETAPSSRKIEVWRMQRRVAVLRHRVKMATKEGKSTKTANYLSATETGETVHFSIWTEQLRKESLPKGLLCRKMWDEDNNLVWRNTCSPRWTVDIFSAVRAEESAVVRLDVFRTWLRQQQQEERGMSVKRKGGKKRGYDKIVPDAVILDLYVREFARSNKWFPGMPYFTFHPKKHSRRAARVWLS